MSCCGVFFHHCPWVQIPSWLDLQSSHSTITPLLLYYLTLVNQHPCYWIIVLFFLVLTLLNLLLSLPNSVSAFDATYLPALATILQTLGRRKSWRSWLLTPSLSLMLCTSPVQWSPSLQLSKSASLILLKVLTLMFLFISSRLIYLFLSCIELVLPKNLWIKILEWNKTCVWNKQLSIVSAFRSKTGLHGPLHFFFHYFNK